MTATNFKRPSVPKECLRHKSKNLNAKAITNVVTFRLVLPYIDVSLTLIFVLC